MTSCTNDKYEEIDENVEIDNVIVLHQDDSNDEETERNEDTENGQTVINIWTPYANDEVDNDEVKSLNDEVDAFIANHALCPKKCTDHFGKADIIRFISESRALDETVDGVNRLNVVLLGIIRVLQCQTFVEPNRQRNASGRKRVSVAYQIHGLAVCLPFFLKVHGIGTTRWSELLKVYKNEGFVEKKHGNCKRKPKNAIPLADTEYVVAFLRNFAAQHALTKPGQIAQKKNTVKLLPSGLWKSTVYQEYVIACTADQKKPVSLVSFRRIWFSCCPDIVMQKT